MVESRPSAKYCCQPFPVGLSSDVGLRRRILFQRQFGHRIPLATVIFADGSFGNVRRNQEERYSNRLIACDLTNPDFVRFAESFGAAAERARNPPELAAALRRAFKRRDGPTLIEVPVGPLPSPWEFIRLPRLRGGSRP